jgi:multiple antibiotic resistance protein
MPLDPIHFGLLCFTSYFTIVNPIGTMPVFMTMTAGLDAKNQERTARKALITAFLTMLLFALSGQVLFSFFGISVDSFRIVGGIIFFQMGQDMLQARLVRTKLEEKEVKQYVTDISITPLGIPMICGPGAITNSIVLMQDAGNLTNQAILITMMFLVCLLSYLILRMSSNISKLLGETGNKVLMRLMGLIIMVIAVEFFLSGFKPIIKSILQ